MQLAGFHHLTAVTADAARNHAFYTQTLGLRLVKKTVNQDDVSAYHLFYADGVASPGSDLTFFDWPAARERRGTRSVVRTGLRVATEASLEWWRARFETLKVAHAPIAQRGGRAVLDFEDPEGQRFALVADDTSGMPHRWKKSPVRAEHQITGLGPIAMSVPELAPTARVLTEVMNLRRTTGYAWTHGGAEREVHVFQMGGEGPQAELHVVVEPGAAPAGPGAGGVHHVAFRTPDREASDAWAAHLAASGIPSSGPIDRFYFRSLYFREPGGVLFEIATDGPGFAVDEPLDELGEKLALPPFLEPRRAEIERGLKPLVTK
ncbi:MAG: ring-cleaving dioxygenase [Opitutaceae bacterium]|nr:ring-cleaving dioxygenase [Opitutaceae bacterium]